MVRLDSRPTLACSNQLPLDMSPRSVVHSKKKKDLMQTSSSLSPNTVCAPPFFPEIEFLSLLFSPISVILLILKCCCGGGLTLVNRWEYRGDRGPTNIGTSCLCVCNSHNKFLESLEDGALIYSIERFVKGELDHIKLFIEVRLSYFIVGFFVTRIMQSQKVLIQISRTAERILKFSLHLQKSVWMITDSSTICF